MANQFHERLAQGDLHGVRLPLSGSGSPVGVVTPTATVLGFGEFYKDNTTGTIWVSNGPTNNDWQIFSEGADTGATQATYKVGGADDAASNTFDSFAKAWAFLTAADKGGIRTLVIDDDLSPGNGVVVAGTYDDTRPGHMRLSGRLFGSFAVGQITTLLTLQDGVKFTPESLVDIDNLLRLRSESTSSIVDVNAPPAKGHYLLGMNRGSILEATTAPFVNCNAAAIFGALLQEGATLANAGAVVYDLALAGAVALFSCGVETEVALNTISGIGGTAVFYNANAPSAVINSGHAGFAGATALATLSNAALVNRNPTTLNAATVIPNDTRNAVFFLDASGGAFTVTLPLALSTWPGLELTFVKVDATLNPITVAGQLGNTINGAANFVLNTQYSAQRIVRSSIAGWIGVGN